MIGRPLLARACKTLRPIISTTPKVGFRAGFEVGLEVGFLSFIHNPTPILPKTEAVEIMFVFILR
jgi:hypothetical protein